MRRSLKRFFRSLRRKLSSRNMASFPQAGDSFEAAAAAWLFQ
jgi:hypothetical protein